MVFWVLTAGSDMKYIQMEAAWSSETLVSYHIAIWN